MRDLIATSMSILDPTTGFSPFSGQGILVQTKLGSPQDSKLLQTCMLLVLIWHLRQNFFQLNKAKIKTGRKNWLRTIAAYRDHYRTEALRKHQILSYSFQIHMYCRPRVRYVDLANTLKRDDTNPCILQIPDRARSGIVYLFERLSIVNQSVVHSWWYLFIVSQADKGISSGYIGRRYPC